MEFDTDIRIVGKPILLGVLGKHEQISKKDIHEKILHPLVSAIGRLPDKLIVPSEGTSSAYITLWAERLAKTSEKSGHYERCSHSKGLDSFAHLCGCSVEEL
jgi:hypothetical protein